jgi:ABC-2 type transport system ATP-binding protein
MRKILSVAGLTQKIGGKPVLQDLSFELEAGRVAGILGPNGAGKTTLLKAILNFGGADTGEITVCGEPASFATRRYISYLPDHNYLFEWMRVRDAIRYFRDMFRDFDRDSAGRLCTFLGISEDAKVKDLSRGMIERVLVMLTFSRKAPLYLLDEPLGGIDPVTRHKIMKTIFAGLNEESSIMIATHLAGEVETLLDEVMFINEGRLVFSGNADTIREVHHKSIEEWYMEVFHDV